MKLGVHAVVPKGTHLAPACSLELDVSQSRASFMAVDDRIDRPQVFPDHVQDVH